MGLLVAGVANMAAAPFFVLGPAIAKDSLGGAGAWALIVAAFSVGSFAGGLVAFRFRPRRPFLPRSSSTSHSVCRMLSSRCNRPRSSSPPASVSPAPG
jgi:hypothetical protein